MPLLPINITQRYRAVFGTIGPVEETWLPSVLSHIDSYCREHFTYDCQYPPKLKFEIGDTGYPHFHLGMFFKDREKYGMFIKRLQQYLLTLSRRPDGKAYSVRLFAVPLKQNTKCGTLVGPALVEHYLHYPTKIKSTDGVHDQVDLAEWSPYYSISTSNDESTAFSELAIAEKWSPEMFKVWMALANHSTDRANSYKVFTKRWYKTMNHLSQRHPGSIYPEMSYYHLENMHANNPKNLVRQFEKIFEKTQNAPAKNSSL